MRDRLVVLGGSSPFTAALIDALADPRAGIPSFDLILTGRNRVHLDRVTAYARGALAPRGWAVGAATDVSRALEGARIVVHQIRYGGMEGRSEDEALASRLGIH